MSEMLRQQLLDTSRGRIVTLLRTGDLTADDIATELRLTRSAVRVQITAMERDGVVNVPLLTHLVDVFAEALPAQQVEALLRRTGKRLATEFAREKRISGDSSLESSPAAS